MIVDGPAGTDNPPLAPDGELPGVHAAHRLAKASHPLSSAHRTNSSLTHTANVRGQSTREALFGCVVLWGEWAVACVAGAGHDDEQVLQLAEYGVVAAPDPLA